MADKQLKMKRGKASWYDPYKGGINGNPNATPCGIPVKNLPWSVAHKTLPCGSVVIITNKDATKLVQTVVADRGPYIPGRIFDLRPDVAKALGIDGVADIQYNITGKRINLKQYASLGGNSSAFSTLYGGNATDKTGAPGIIQPPQAFDIPGDDGLLPDIPNPLKGIDLIADVLKAIWEHISSGPWWLNVAKVLSGLFLIAFGLQQFSKVAFGVNPVGAVKKVAPVV